MKLFLTGGKGTAVFAEDGSRVGGVQGTDGVGRMVCRFCTDRRKHTDARFRGQHVEDRMVTVHIGPGVGRHNKQAVLQLVGHGGKQSLGTAVDFSDAFQGDVHGDTVG